MGRGSDDVAQRCRVLHATAIVAGVSVVGSTGVLAPLEYPARPWFDRAVVIDVFSCCLNRGDRVKALAGTHGLLVSTVVGPVEGRGIFLYSRMRTTTA